MTVIDQIIDSPRLPQYVKELKQVLVDERRRRQQFFEHVTEEQKAEFINGRIVVHSPVRLEHNAASFGLAKLIGAYVEKHALGFVGHEKLMISLTRNDYEPDICYFKAAKAAKFKPTQMKFPAPDLVVEVLSASTEKIDRGIKFEDYAAHGVDEYWIVDPSKRTVEQYRLSGSRYTLEHKLKTGSIRSEVIEGLKIPVRAAFDAKENVKALVAIVGT